MLNAFLKLADIAGWFLIQNKYNLWNKKELREKQTL